MLIVVLLVLIVVGSILLVVGYAEDWHDNDPLQILGSLGAIVGSGVIIGLVFGLWCIAYNEGKRLVEYEVDKSYIEYVVSLENPTWEQVVNATDMVKSHNETILINRIRRNSIWVGAFYPDAIGDLDTFDFLSLNGINPTSEININMK